MSYKQNVEIEYISRGNSSAILDSKYEAIFRFSGEWPSFTDGRPFHPSQSYVEDVSKLFLRNWEKKAEDDRGWWENYLKVCEETAPGEWHVIIIEPGTD
jgi:hypothetical protein